MEFEDQEEEEMGLPASYDSLGHASRVVVAEPNKSGPSTKRPSSSTNRYRECLKNHAVGIGGHAVDGCGEFMPGGEEGTLDALKCAACNCHRNFHRKETDGGDPFQYQYSPYYRTGAARCLGCGGIAASDGYGGAVGFAVDVWRGGGAMSREDQEEFTDLKEGGKKRFRTKFTQEQKDKMLEFAEKVGWRIQKHDEAAVQQFCTETCVKRHVLKVWMHNNKHTLGKKP